MLLLHLESPKWGTKSRVKINHVTHNPLVLHGSRHLYLHHISKAYVVT